MVSSVKHTDEKISEKRYKVQHSIDEYTFPKDAYIHDVTFDEKYMHVELTDQRMMSIPLWWIPTVYNASMDERRKFEINQSRTMIVWNPAKCKINDEINIADYLGPAGDENKAVYKPRVPKRLVAEPKAKLKKK
jgi:diacylglycerol kinase family enzyme